MGLGPAVCQHCQVVAEHQYIDEHPFHRIWCKFCGETNIKDSAGLGDDKRWKMLEENKRKLEKIYNFVKGIDNDNNNGNSSKEDS